MATSAANTTGPALEIRRTFNAPRERVFAAWTQPEKLQQWSAPGAMMGKAEVDLKVGGRYKITMTDPTSGGSRVVGGEYRVVDPPSRLVYSWSWLDRENAAQTLVTIEFHERGKATEVILRHEGFLTEQDCRRHEEGWNGGLAKLVNLI
jgi:uncharacterized protein YndB with AHSA1/START domain